MSRVQRAIAPVYSAVIMLCAGWFLTACGPCASLQSDFDARMRHELQYLAVDDRVESSGRAHGHLHIGPQAFDVVSAAALKDEASYYRTIAVSVPEHIWGYKGQIRLETSIRLDHIDTRFTQPGWDAKDVALNAVVMVRARIEVPGKRARWTWYARAAMKTSLHAEDDLVNVSLENAALVNLEANMPWENDGMPTEIDDIVSNGIADAISAVLLENQDARFTVMMVRPLNFSSMSFPIRVASSTVDEQRRLSIAFHTALRPIFTDDQPQTPKGLDDVGPADIELQVPGATLDAALRQQSMRGSTPTFVRYPTEEEPQWQAFWGDGAIEDGAWSGAWSLWRFETLPCRHRTLKTTARVAVEDGTLVVSRDPIPSEETGDAFAMRDGPASLARLQRVTLSDMTTEVMRWFTSDERAYTLRPVLRRVRLDQGHLDAVFSLQ